MIGGRVQQWTGTHVEVFDHHNFDRCWRIFPDGPPLFEPQEGDRIWWQSGSTYLSRGSVMVDRDIGRSFPADPPRREEAGS